MKFEIDVMVRVVNYDDNFNGKTGKTKKVHHDLDVEPVYTIKYEDSNNSGMFPESYLELV